MSMKLYNGYKIKGLNLQEQKEFIDFIKNETLNLHKEKMLSLYSIINIATIDDLCELDYNFEKTKNAQPIEKTLRTIYKVRQHSIGYFANSLYKQENFMIEKDMEKIRNELNYEFISSIDYTTFQYIENKGYFVNLTQQNNMHYDFDDAIVFFPLSNEETLLLVYGNTLVEVFEKLEKSRKKKDINFKKQFNFKYYGYQNSGDKPIKVSQKEWDNRKKDWNFIFKDSTIPSNVGIVVELFSTNTLMQQLSTFSFMKNNKKELEKLIVSKKDRVERYALKKAKQEFILSNVKENTPSEYLNLSDEWKKLYEQKDEKVIQHIETLKTQYNLFIKDITLEDYKKTILSFLPNYLKSIENK